MSQLMRVRICRAAFVLLCLLPTLGFVGWISRAASSNSRSTDKALWEDELSRILGLKIRIERVEQPELGRTLLYGVEIFDPEGGLLARAHAIELARTEAGLVIAAEHPELQASRLARLWETLEGVLRTRGPRDLAIHFTAHSLTLHEASDVERAARAMTLADVDAQIGESDVGPWLQATFRRENGGDSLGPGDKPTQFHVVRCCRGEEERTTRWLVDTGSTWLPCWPLLGAVPEIAVLGPDCEFAGRLTCERKSAGWQTEADVGLHRIDLQRLVSRPFGREISGIADVRLSGLRLRDGKLETVQGEVSAADGRLSQSILQAAVSCLPMQCTAPPDANGRRYGRVHFEFELVGDHIAWRGLCDGPGFVFATDPEGNALVNLMPIDDPQRSERETTAALWQALTVDESSPGSIALLERLVFPQASPRNSTGDVPRARMRPFRAPPN